jgi:hypothetical protein
MFLFWLSIILAIVIGGFTLLNITVGIGLQVIGLVLAGNAYVRMQRGKPAKNRINMGATWVALAISAAGLALGLYRIAA